MIKPSVLVIDDCPDARLLMRLMLTPRGYQVEEAGDATEASAILCSQAFDVIILDVALAGLDGFTLALELREGVLGPLNANTIIIGCTGLYVGKRDLGKQATGMDRFVFKPINVREFISMIDELVQANTTQPETAPQRALRTGL